MWQVVSKRGALIASSYKLQSAIWRQAKELKQKYIYQTKLAIRKIFVDEQMKNYPQLFDSTPG